MGILNNSECARSLYMQKDNYHEKISRFKSVPLRQMCYLIWRNHVPCQPEPNCSPQLRRRSDTRKVRPRHHRIDEGSTTSFQTVITDRATLESVRLQLLNSYRYSGYPEYLRCSHFINERRMTMNKILFGDALCVLVSTMIGMTVFISCAFLVPSDVPYRGVFICSSAFLTAAGTAWGILAGNKDNNHDQQI